MVAGSSPIDVHRVELARAILLLRDLTVDDWARPVDPPELAGWTVHDVVVHLVANESLLADQLGVPVPGIPETATDNEGRTAQARARHAGRPPAHAVAELEAAAEATDTEVTRPRRGPPRRADRLVGRPCPDADGAAGAGLRDVDPRRRHPPCHRSRHGGSHRRRRCSRWPTPRAASCRGCSPSAGGYHPGRLVRFRFTDLGDAAWDVDLGAVGGVRPAGDDAVDAEIVTEAAAFCRGISARLDPRELTYDVVGDEQLARDVVDALPALAVL